MQLVSDIANFSQIFTAIVAVFGYTIFRIDGYNRRKKLENYLREEKEKAIDNGQRSTLHLMARLGLTEDEILQASVKSSNIDRKIAKNYQTNRAVALLFEWIDSRK